MAPEQGSPSYPGGWAASLAREVEVAGLARPSPATEAQSESLSLRPRSVRFASSSSVHLISTVSELVDEAVAEELWNTYEDTTRMEREMVQSVKAHRQGKIDENGGELTIRGLEHLKSPRELQLRKEIKENSVAAVLSEQRRQISAGNWCDESLRKAYGLVSSEAQDLALERGASDAAYVRLSVVLPLVKRKEQKYSSPTTPTARQPQCSPLRAASLAAEELPTTSRQQPQQTRRNSYSALGGMLARLNNNHGPPGNKNGRSKSWSAGEAPCVSLLGRALELTGRPPVVAPDAIPGTARSASSLDKEKEEELAFVPPSKYTAEELGSRSCSVKIHGISTPQAHAAKAKRGSSSRPRRAVVLTSQHQQPSL